MRTEQSLASPLERPKAPNGSMVTYGFVGSCLALGVTLATASFYQIDLFGHIALVAGLTALAFIAGIILHAARTSRHSEAAAASPSSERNIDHYV